MYNETLLSMKTKCYHFCIINKKSKYSDGSHSSVKQEKMSQVTQSTLDLLNVCSNHGLFKVIKLQWTRIKKIKKLAVYDSDIIVTLE